MYSEHALTQTSGFTYSHRQSTPDPPTYPHNHGVIHRIARVFHRDKGAQAPSQTREGA